MRQCWRESSRESAAPVIWYLGCGPYSIVQTSSPVHRRTHQTRRQLSAEHADRWLRWHVRAGRDRDAKQLRGGAREPLAVRARASLQGNAMVVPGTRVTARTKARGGARVNGGDGARPASPSALSWLHARPAARRVASRYGWGTTGLSWRREGLLPLRQAQEDDIAGAGHRDSAALRRQPWREAGAAAVAAPGWTVFQIPLGAYCRQMERVWPRLKTAGSSQLASYSRESFNFNIENRVIKVESAIEDMLNFPKCSMCD
jgi:hypothetical protein